MFQGETQMLQAAAQMFQAEGAKVSGPGSNVSGQAQSVSRSARVLSRARVLCVLYLSCSSGVICFGIFALFISSRSFWVRRRVWAGFFCSG